MTSEPVASSQSERVREGIALFNRGEFFECHEVLESVWLEASGEDKTFLQGLIQVAVSFYHLRRSNYTGAGRLLRAGIDKLSGCTASPHPVDLRAVDIGAIDIGDLLGRLHSLLEQIEAGRAQPETSAPEIRLLSVS